MLMSEYSTHGGKNRYEYISYTITLKHTVGKHSSNVGQQVDVNN